MSRTWHTLAALSAVLALTALAYWPGLSGDFAFDDYGNIIDNKRLWMQELSVEEIRRVWNSGTTKPFSRAISMLSFGLQIYFGIDTAYWFKLVNLCIHLFNGLLVFSLISMLLARSAEQPRPQAVGSVTIAVTAAWLLHPLNLTSVLYVVQRMNSMSATFTLLGLCAYVLARSHALRAPAPFRWNLAAAAGLVAGGYLGLLCKENAVLIVVYAAIIEWLCFQGAPLVPRRVTVVHWALLVTGILASCLAFWLVYDWLHSVYATRHFTLLERLLTEARALWFYMKMLVVPTSVELGIFHDDFTVSKSLFQPWSTLFAVAGLFGLLISAVALRRRWWPWSFAVLWFLGGHLVESTFMPLELVHEHRNYLPSLGPIFAAFYFLAAPASKLFSTAFWRCVALAMVLLFGLQTFVRAEQWGDAVLHAALEARHHPNSYRANYMLGRVYLYNNHQREAKYYELARKQFAIATGLVEYSQKALFAAIQTAFLQGQQPDEQTYRQLVRRLREQPFLIAEVPDFAALLRCIDREVCKIEERWVREIFQAALSNHTLKPKAAAELWNLYGVYVFHLHSFREAEQYFRNCIALRPGEVQYHLNLVNVYSVLGEFEQGTQSLQTARDLDELGAYREALEEAQGWLTASRARRVD